LRRLCIFHSPCFDGFAAAWAVHAAHANTEFVGGVFGFDPPDVTGRDVVIVDFSYPRPVLEKMIASCRTLLVLDHHKTAEADLCFLPDAHGEWGGDGAAAVFRMENSGAILAWSWFHSGPPPPLLLHIEDRDLWRFALPGTREIFAALSSYPQDFATWDELMRRPVESLRREGVSLERKQLADVAMLVPITRRRMVIGGYDVPVANLPITLISDAGNAMAVGEPFAACYFDTEKGRVFSLRSVGDVDVSKIAESYGGGGHPRAAGFQRNRNWEGDGT
jgi:hypothetical protein